MSWTRQVVHVAWKDIRLARWVLGIHVLLSLAGAIAAAVGWSVVPESFWGPVITVSGMLLIAVVVQADSPFRPDASWAYHPLRPSAVFAAKAAVVLVLAPVPPLLGQLVALWAHGAAGADIPSLLGISALHYGVWLGVAAAVAAITPDLRTFAVIALGVAAARSVVSMILFFNFRPDPFGAGPASGVQAAVQALLIAGLVAVLAYQYGTRRRGRGLALAGVVLLGAAALPATLRSAAPLGRAEAPSDLPADVRRPVLAIQEVRPQAGQLELRLAGEAPRGQQYRWQLVDLVVLLRLPEGETVRIPAVNRPFDLTSRGSLDDWDASGTLQWLNRRSSPSTDLRASVSAPLSGPHGRLIAEGDVTVTLRGRVRALEPRLAAALPAKAGAATTTPGRRVRITDVLATPRGPSFQVQISTVFRSGGSFPEVGLQSTSYTLVNHDREETAALSGGGSGGSKKLLLPGVQTWETTSRLELTPHPTMPPSEGPIVTDRWLDDAELRIVEWVAVGSYPAEIHPLADEGL